MLSRLTQYWVYGGFLAGILLLALVPVLAQNWSMPLLAVFLQLPIYMLHQYEEHDNDRFRIFVNRKLAGGLEVLSHEAVFLINVPGVWGVIAVSFYLASDLAIGFGLIAVYLSLINALVHVAQALVSRTYNPGVVTAILLFVPLGVFGLLELHKTGKVGFGYHLLGLFVGLAIHVAIVAYALTKKRRIMSVNQHPAAL